MPETGENLVGGEMIVASFLVPGVPVPSALPRQHLDILQGMLADGPRFSPYLLTPLKKSNKAPIFVKRLSYKSVSSSPPSTSSLLP